MSAILVVERVSNQIPVYYMSHALVRAKLSYPLIDKFTYSLVLASRKLCHYLDGHKVTLLTNQPLKNVLQKFDAFRRLLK